MASKPPGSPALENRGCAGVVGQTAILAPPVPLRGHQALGPVARHVECTRITAEGTLRAQRQRPKAENRMNNQVSTHQSPTADDFASTTAPERASKRLSGPGRRAQLIETASAEFAISGLRGTTTAALAKAAGISEPTLYLHFESKEQMFRETIEHNVQERLRRLDALLLIVPTSNLKDCVRAMAEQTVLAGLFEGTSAVLMAWAVLEAPDYALDLHRGEIGSICLMWELRLARVFPEVRSHAAFWTRLVHESVHACVAYGSWLAALRHTPQSASALAQQFAVGISLAASGAIAERGAGTVPKT